MKTVILYDTKKGCTKKCAEYLHEKVPNSELFTLQTFDTSLQNYDSVILLSPIYVGQVRKGMKKLIEAHRSELLQRPLSIALCGMNKDGFDETIQLSFDKEIREHAAIHLVGGAYYFDKLNFLEKMVVKKIAKVSQSSEEINYEELNKVAQQ